MMDTDLNLWQEPHDRPGSCEAQAGEQVGALSGGQQRRQVLLRPGRCPDQSSRTLIDLQLRLRPQRLSKISLSKQKAVPE